MAACHETFTAAVCNAAFDFASSFIISSIVAMLVVVINIRLFFFFDSERLGDVLLSAPSNTNGRAEV